MLIRIASVLLAAAVIWRDREREIYIPILACCLLLALGYVVSRLAGNLIADRRIQDMAGYDKYDIVTANILAPVLVELTPQIVSHLKNGGIYITSGILDVKEEDVTKACTDAGLTVAEVTRQGEWVSVTARKD